MRVELSPWEVSETSFRHGGDSTGSSSSPKRRRQRSDSLSKIEKLLTASFIEQTSSSMRSRKKRKGRKGRLSKTPSAEEEDRMPVLTLTSPHRIAVIVENDSSNKDGASTGLQESSILQFASRPSNATAFLPLDDSSHVNGSAKHCEEHVPFTPLIPAVFDAQLNRVYALQKNNTKLVSYQDPASSANGSESETSSSISAHLEHAACGLSLIHLPRTTTSSARCVVYGTCHDGRIFVACCAGCGDKEQLLVEFIDTTFGPSHVDRHQQHVGTLAYLMTSSTARDSSGSKRTLDDTLETDSFMLMFYQIFREDCGIALVRQKVQIAFAHGVSDGSSWANAVAGSRNQKSTASANLTATNDDGLALAVSHASVLGFVEGNNAITLFYSAAATSSARAPKATNGKATMPNVSGDERSFYTTISLRTGRSVGAPITLPDNTQQVGLIGPALLAVLTTDREVLLFDTIRGAQVYACRPLPPEDDGGCFLVADSKRSRLALVFARHDKYAVAFASVHADNDVSMQPLLRGPRLSLAAGLASSLTAPALSFAPGATRTLGWDENLVEPSTESVEEQNAVAKGVQLLEDAYRKVRDGAKEAAEPTFLIDAYNVALKVSQGVDASPANGRNEDNPQDAVLSKNGKKANGIHHSPCVKKAYLAGVDAETGRPHRRPRASPQSFLESAISVAVAIICSSTSVVVTSAVRNDARLLLRRLVRSGKVSARTHLVQMKDMAKTSSFTGLLRALELSTEETGTWSAYTPFDLANDIFKFCPDVSERQMIAAIHYTVSRALPKDIASFFVRDKNIGEQHPFFRRSARFAALQSKRQLSAGEKNEMTLLGHKLIISGTAFLIQHVIEYSRCNAALLRDALESELSQDEVKLLARCFMDIVTAPAKFRLAPKAGATRNALQCLSALFDSLRNSLADDGGRTFARIRSTVSTELSRTGIIMSLQKTLQESVESIASGAAGRSEASMQVTNGKKPSTSLPPYQIERLVF